MNTTSELYKTSLALLTDLYQITMAYGYWKCGLTQRQAAFHLSFRAHPFDGGFSVACGLEYVVDFLSHLRFEADDLSYLAALNGHDGRPLFEPAFLDYLHHLDFTCDIDAIPEGSIVFPHEPLVRVTGPILQCQLLETPLLNMINFQTLIATKAARICLAAGDQPVLEFGLRRAQGIDGGLAASRAAYIGGCAATSNVLAGKLFDIPVRGTHAHSWIMCFEDELEAFSAYARAMPNNVVFLVDTYNTLQGVRHACQVGQRLREQGHELLGVRLDSGDLAYLSVEARKILDEAGFPEAKILATNELDEHLITSLKQQHAAITVWGVGTRLATAFDQPAMGGVYKLSAVRDDEVAWSYRIKLSEQTAKTSIPGLLQVRRFQLAGEYIGDAIYNLAEPFTEPMTLIDPQDLTRRKTMPPDARHEDLLKPIFRQGRCVYDAPSIAEVRRRTQDQLRGFHAGIKRFLNPHLYPVGLERRLHELRMELILKARGMDPQAPAAS